MTQDMGRRQVILTSLGLVALAGTAAAGGPGAVPAQAAGGKREREFPDVPGMHGDRRANELWYSLDEATMYNASQEFKDAYTAIKSYLGGSPETALREKWFELSAASEYPHNFTSFVTPMREPLRVVSRTQLDVFLAFYGRRDPRLAEAFSYFGEGVLFDPRRAPAEQEVHTMNSREDIPPVAYHTWHAYIRAMMLLGIDRRHWAEVAPLNGLAWAVQSVAKPAMRQINPSLPRGTVAELASRWLPRGTDRLDREFQSFPYPAETD
jgi:hypothetical protein